MSMMFAMLVHKLSIMHLVTRSKSYKTAFRVVTLVVATLALGLRPRQGLAKV
jgi:hypothetical protein